MFPPKLQTVQWAKEVYDAKKIYTSHAKFHLLKNVSSKGWNQGIF